jgi:hypothetical protein
MYFQKNILQIKLYICGEKLLHKIGLKMYVEVNLTLYIKRYAIISLPC